MRQALIAVLALFVASVAHAEQGVTGEVLTIKTAFGTDFDAYAAGPEDATRAVLLLHDRYGMSAQVREWADRFAEQGYRALVIDLYDGRHAKDWKQATSIMTAIDQVAADADVAATVVYYPTALETIQDKLQTIVRPVLVVVAERDEQLATPQILAFKDGMSKTHVDFNVMGVDAERGFVNPMYNHFDANATQTVWDVTQEFLGQYVTGELAAATGDAAQGAAP